ncbi:MAG: hypothetical protein [Bacteriophage sp.]|nr:MAG: hypothetical protein [Bacteriophage sp.]
MESLFDFESNTIWFSENQHKWMFLNKPFKRKGQAAKACFEEYKRRKRLGLPLKVLANTVI